MTPIQYKLFRHQMQEHMYAKHFVLLFHNFNKIFLSRYSTYSIAHVMKACKNTEIRKEKKNKQKLFFFTEILRSQRFGCESQILHNFFDVSKIIQTLQHQYMVARPIQVVNVNVTFHDCPVQKKNNQIINKIKQQWSSFKNCALAEERNV